VLSRRCKIIEVTTTGGHKIRPYALANLVFSSEFEYHFCRGGPRVLPQIQINDIELFMYQ